MSTISNIQKINSQVSPADLLTNLKKNIDFWSDATQQSLKKTEAYAGGNETSKKELQELNDFLEGPLRKRLMGVYQEENELKSRYLRALEPFYTEGGLHQFIEHHYDVILNPMDDSVAYRKKEPFEKEVGILFVLFKVKKTIETIVTLQNSIDSEEEFPSSFTKEKQQEYLKILKEILKLFLHSRT